MAPDDTAHSQNKPAKAQQKEGSTTGVPTPTRGPPDATARQRAGRRAQGQPPRCQDWWFLGST